MLKSNPELAQAFRDTVDAMNTPEARHKLVQDTCKVISGVQQLQQKRRV